MQTITSVPCKCKCGWRGCVGDCDSNDDVSLACPSCSTVIDVTVNNTRLYRALQQVVHCLNDIIWKSHSNDGSNEPPGPGERCKYCNSKFAIEWEIKTNFPRTTRAPMYSWYPDDELVRFCPYCGKRLRR